MPAADGALYDADFYAWTQEQAELLRRGPAAAKCPYSLAQILSSGGEEDWFPPAR